MSTKLGTLTLDLIVGLGGFTSPLDQAAAHAQSRMGSISNSAHGASSSIDGISSKVKGLAGVIAAGMGVSEISRMSDQWTGLQNRLKLVTNSQYELATASKDVFNVAQSTYGAMDGVAVIYSNFAKNAERLALSQADVAQMTKTVAQAVAISGGTAESASAAINQFGQSLASGVFRGEEFNSVAEQAPGLMQALSVGLGKTSGELRAMANEGKLTSDVLKVGLSNAAEKVQADFNKTAVTISQSVTQINNAKIRFVGEESSAGARVLAAALSEVAQNFDTVAKSAGVLVVGAATLYFAKLSLSIHAATMATLANAAATRAAIATAAAEAATNATRTASIALYTSFQVADAQATAARMTGMARLAYVQATLIPLQAAHAAALEVNTVAQVANTQAQSRAVGMGTILRSTLFGPVGLAVAVAAVAAGFLFMGDKADEARPKLSELGNTVDQIRGKFGELNREQRAGFILGIGQKIKEDEKNIKDSTESIITSLRTVSAWSVAPKDRPKLFKLADDLEAGKIDPVAAMQQIRDQKLLSQEKVDGLTKHSSAIEANVLDLRDQHQQQAELLKQDKEMITGFDKMSKAERDKERIARAVVQQKKEGDAQLVESAKNSKRQLEDLKDPTEAGKAARDIRDAIANGKRYSQSQMDASIAIGKEKDNFKLKQDAEKKATDDLQKSHEKLAATLNQQKNDYVALADSMKSPFEKINEETAKNLKLIAMAGKGAFATKETTTGKSNNTDTNPVVEFTTPKGAKVSWDRSQGDFNKALATLPPEQAKDALAGWNNYFQKTVQLRQFAANNAIDITKSEVEQQNAIQLERRDSETDAILLGYDQQLAALTDRAKSEQIILGERYDFEKRKIMQIIALDPITKAHKQSMLDALAANQRQDADHINYARGQDLGSISQRIGDAQAQSDHNDQKIGMGSAQASMFDKTFQIQNQAKNEIDRNNQTINDPLTNDDLKNHLQEKNQLIQESANKEIEIEQNSQTYKKSLQDEQYQATANMFGNLAVLSNSKNREMAAIGKAAAIAQATMNTYQAATGAFAALAGIPIIGPALATASAGAIIVAGLANVAQIAGVGFETGGFTGVGGNKEVAGVVHRNEFVNNAASTAKNRPILEAMNAGTFDPKSYVNSSSSSSARNAQANGNGAKQVINTGITVNIENYGSDKAFDVQQLDENTVRIIARDEIAKDGGDAAAQALSNPNSRMSKAMNRNTSAQRNRG